MQHLIKFAIYFFFVLGFSSLFLRKMELVSYPDTKALTQVAWNYYICFRVLQCFNLGLTKEWCWSSWSSWVCYAPESLHSFHSTHHSDHSLTSGAVASQTHHYLLPLVVVFAPGSISLVMTERLVLKYQLFTTDDKC